MRISPSPVCDVDEQDSQPFDGTGMPRRERSRRCEVPYVCEICRFFLPSHCGLADAISLQQRFADGTVAKLLRSDGCSKESTRRCSRHRARET
jgi:hypothetical protein